MDVFTLWIYEYPFVVQFTFYVSMLVLSLSLPFNFYLLPFFDDIEWIITDIQ